MTHYYIYAVCKSGALGSYTIQKVFCKDKGNNEVLFDFEQLLNKIESNENCIFFITKEQINYQIFMDPKTKELRVSSNTDFNAETELLRLPTKTA